MKNYTIRGILTTNLKSVLLAASSIEPELPTPETFEEKSEGLTLDADGLEFLLEVSTLSNKLIVVTGGEPEELPNGKGNRKHQYTTTIIMKKETKENVRTFISFKFGCHSACKISDVPLLLQVLTQHIDETGPLRRPAGFLPGTRHVLAGEKRENNEATV